MADETQNAGAGGPGGGEQKGDAGATPWTQGLDADALGYVQNKGWKGPGDVLTSYRNLEKLHGLPPEQIVRLPKDDDPKAWGEVYDRLGRPKAPADYGIQAPEKGGDKAFVEWAQGTFHELGLTTKQAAGLVEKWNKLSADKMTERTAAGEAALAEDMGKLKAEWAGNYDANIKTARLAARTFGLDAAQIDKMQEALGFGGLMRFMHNIGAKVGRDDSFVTGDKGDGGFGMTKEAAASRRAELMRDKAFGARFAAGDVAARAEMRRIDTILSA